MTTSVPLVEVLKQTVIHKRTIQRSSMNAMRTVHIATNDAVAKLDVFRTFLTLVAHGVLGEELRECGVHAASAAQHCIVAAVHVAIEAELLIQKLHNSVPRMVIESYFCGEHLHFASGQSLGRTFDYYSKQYK